MVAKIYIFFTYGYYGFYMFHVWLLGFLYVSRMVIRVSVCFTYGF